jgi:Rho-associated protein kinase 2
VQGENKKADQSATELPMLALDKAGITQYMGHDFINISFRTPTVCEGCSKPVWHMFHPPPALECRR